MNQYGQQLQNQIGELRDQLLGGRRPGESLEDYRLRSSQAQATAEKVVLTNEHLTIQETGEVEDLTMDDDPAVASYYLRLATIEQALADTSSQAS